MPISSSLSTAVAAAALLLGDGEGRHCPLPGPGAGAGPEREDAAGAVGDHRCGALGEPVVGAPADLGGLQQPAARQPVAPRPAPAAGGPARRPARPAGNPHASQSWPGLSLPVPAPT